MVNFMKKNKEELAGVILTAGILLFFLIFDMFYLDHVNDADIAAEYLLAKVLARENAFFTPSWYYSFDIRVLYIQLVAAPLFKIFDSYYTVMGISNFIWNILLLASYYLFMKAIGIKNKWIFFTMPVLITSFSKLTFYYIFGGNFYQPYISWVFICLTLLIHIAEGKRHRRLFTAVFCLLNLLLGLGGYRYIAVLFLPTLLAGAYFFFHESKNYRVKEIRQMESLPYFSASVMGFLTAFIGFVINNKILVNYYSFENLSDRGFIEVSELGNQLLSTVVSFLQSIGFYGGADLFSLKGIANCFAFVFLFAAVYIMRRIKEIKLKNRQRFMLYYAVAGFLVICLISFFTGDMSTVLYKYVINASIMIIPVMALYLDHAPENLQKNLVKLLIISVVLVMNLVTFTLKVTDNDNGDRLGYVAYLKEHDLNYGYATFWNCDITTFMCDNGTDVVPVEDSRSLSPYYWLAEKRIFASDYNRSGQFFVLLSAQEEAPFVNNGKAADGKRVYADESYVIYLFQKNSLWQ